MANEWKEPLKWENSGIEPSDTLKTEGFKAGYKPPAELFNYFLHRTYECFLELQKSADNAKSLVGGTRIANGSDLNSYKTVGNYHCINDQDAQSLSNCPIKNAFNMVVGYPTGQNAYLYQEITHYLTGTRYYRECLASSDSWSNWVKSYDSSNLPSLPDLSGILSAEKGGTGKSSLDDVTVGYAIHPVMINRSNTDINELKSAGFYYGYTGMANAAVENEISVFQVISYSTDWLLQIQTRLTDGRSWFRYFYSGTSWSDWYRYYTSKDKPTPTDIGAANTAFNNIPDISVALKNIRATDNFKGTVDGTNLTFNTALTQAEYSVAGIDIPDAPYTGNTYGKLVVIVNSGGTHDNASNWIWQVFYSTLFGRIYFRSKVNDGAWSSWAMIYNQNNKPALTDLSGTLPIKNGGTGGTTQNSAVTNILCRMLINDTSIVDANTLVHTGIHKVYVTDSTLATNNHYPYVYGNLFVVSNMESTSYTYVMQLFFAADGNFFVRSSTNNGSSWTDWAKAYTNRNKPTVADVGATPDGIGAYGLKEGTDIAEKTDLNTIVAVGNYQCTSNTIAATLTNCPTTDAFTMKVKYANGSAYYIMQEVLGHTNGTVYRRTRNGADYSWSEWVRTYNTKIKPTPAEIGAAAASHNHGAEQITSGVFGATNIKAKTGTDYTYERIRNMSLNTAETNPTENGAIAWTYE